MDRRDDFPTHADILARVEARMDDLEAKVDRLCVLTEKANGAWFLLKVMGSIALGAAAFWSSITSFWSGQ